MELRLLGTLYDRQSYNIKDKSQANYVTFGLSKYYEGVPPRLVDYVTIGIKDGSAIATVEVSFSEIATMVDILSSAKNMR